MKMRMPTRSTRKMANMRPPMAPQAAVMPGQGPSMQMGAPPPPMGTMNAMTPPRLGSLKHLRQMMQGHRGGSR